MNSYISRDRGNLAIIDGRADIEIVKNLKKLNLDVIRTTRCEEVYDSISYHPDIVMHPIDINTLLIAPNLFAYYKKKLAGRGIRLIKGSRDLGNKYPENILYNVGRIGNLAIHNTKYTDIKLKKLLNEEGLSFLYVKQGYSKCSLGLIDNKVGITSDLPIYNKLKDRGYDMLLIEPGYIKLKGQKYGFIGGCMGNLDRKTVLFTGRLDCHPNKEEILRFIDDHDKDIIYLSDKVIEDLGSIFILKTR